MTRQNETVRRMSDESLTNAGEIERGGGLSVRELECEQTERKGLRFVNCTLASHQLLSRLWRKDGIEGQSKLKSRAVRAKRGLT